MGSSTSTCRTCRVKVKDTVMVGKDCGLCWEHRIKNSTLVKCTQCGKTIPSQEVKPSYGICVECCYFTGINVDAQVACPGCHSKILKFFNKEHKGFCRGCAMSKSGDV